MVRKIVFTALLMAMASGASAHVTHDGDDRGDRGDRGDKCEHNLWFESCTSSHKPLTVKAPEFEASSAMAGLTLMVGGLAVLRGRRTKNSKA